MTEDKLEADKAEFPGVDFSGDTGATAGLSDRKEFADIVNFEPEASSALDKAIAFEQGAVGGFLKTAPVLAGAASGFAATAAIPIPGARVVGTVAGGIAGYFAGEGANEFLSETTIPGTDIAPTRRNIEAFPPDQRPFAVGGEAFGGATSFGGATIAIAKQGFRFGESFVGNFLNRILTSAQHTTRTFVAAETAGATGAAGGGALAEVVDPGDKLSRFGGEVAGGILNPTRILLGFSNKAVNTFKRVLQTFSTGARESRAAEVIGQMIEESGGDPILLARMLEAEGLPGIGAQTAATKTGNKALAELQAQLIATNGRFSAEAGLMTEKNLSNLDNMIRALRSSGNPGALKAAAEIEATKFQMLLGGRLNAAEAEVMRDVQNISQLTPGARTALSKQATEIVTQVKTAARAAEHELWEAIPNHIRVKADDVFEEVHIIRIKEMLPDEKMPSEVANFVKRHTAEGADGTVSMGEMILLRKRLLVLASDAQLQGKGGKASIYGRVAESVLDSMDTTFGPQSKEGVNRVLGLSADAYNKARGFSFALNEAFTRTFAGQALAKGPKGTPRVPAELILQKALRSGGDEGAMRVRELEEATRFMSVHGLADVPVSNQMMSDMMDAQENLVRIMALDAVDPLTNRVSRQALAQFMKKNPQLMKRFPHIEKDLKKAMKSELDLQNIVRSQEHANRVVAQQAAFAKVAKFDNSVQAVRGAIAHVNPERELSKLVKLADKGGFQAQEGLRSSVFDHVIEEGSRLTGNLNYKQMRAAFFDPLQAGGKQSLIDIMRKTGIFQEADVKRLTQLLDEGDKILEVSATATRAAEDALLPQADAMTDLLTRVTGAVSSSRAAKWLGLGGQGPSLIIASAGSRAAQSAMDRVPQAAIRQVFIEAATKPKFMAMLLKKPRTPKEAVDFNRQIHAYLLQAGFIPLRDEGEAEELQTPTGS